MSSINTIPIGVKIFGANILLLSSRQYNAKQAHKATQSIISHNLYAAMNSCPALKKPPTRLSIILLAKAISTDNIIANINTILTSIFCTFLSKIASIRCKAYLKYLILILSLTSTSYASCHGRFINPITDICWSCILPISIGGLNIGKGNTPSKRDTKNPSSPICICTKNNIPIPGIAVGFWEPVRLVEATQTPYCMTLLGAIKLGNDFKKTGSWQKSYETSAYDKHSFYHLHYYIYPIIYWLELLTDFVCLEKSTFDVGYMSEFDVTWSDEKLQNLLNPESFLFANPVAQSASAIDCTQATLDFANDNLFWCAGCYGNLYPLSGYNANHSGGIQTSSLLTTRILAKMHKIGLAKETSTSDSSINGRLCKKTTHLKLKKSQYKLQMLYPKSTNQCFPLGYSDMLYSPYNEYPNDGQDFGYLIWRKVNCCAL